MGRAAAIWRDDLDALSFAVVSDDRDHGAACFVHRRAFRILIGSDPVGADCIAYYRNNAAAFQAAAWAKIEQQGIAQGRSLNINSRDIRRALGELVHDPKLGKGGRCRILTGKE